MRTPRAAFWRLAWQEPGLILGQDRVARRVCRPPRRGLLDGGQLAPPVQEGRDLARVRPSGRRPPAAACRGSELACSPVEPAAQPGPRAQQDVVGDLDGIAVQDQQTAAGEGFQHVVDRAPGRSRRPAHRSARTGRTAGQLTVRADQDQRLEDLPGDRAARRRAGPHRRPRRRTPRIGRLRLSRCSRAPSGGGLRAFSQVSIIAWDNSGRTPSASSWPAVCRSARMMSARLASICEPGRGSRAGDRLPQFRAGHRADHEQAVLHHAGQPGVRRAPGPEVAADRDDHQGRRLAARPGRPGRRRAQGGDERLLAGIAAAGIPA